MTVTKTKEIVAAYITLLEPLVKAGRLDTPFRMFDAVMESARNPLAFAYDRTGAIVRNSARSSDGKPCIYVLILKDGRDPFLRSTAMFKGANNDNRIERQKCGILFGSSWACRNFAQRYIALKLELDFDLPSEIDPRIVYPTMDEDPISREIVEKFSLACEMLDRHDGSASSEARFPPSFVSSW
ncbi:hypothetical protein JQ595_16595 [Bradyrhizobium japonicum]|uniref:hypothetical protein n=1 Tax=Bradyrhizobium japonicum TaxID=375 RepID=UPI001BACEB5A|nr:hypothetical protein [Bradyrhizobium japonicum]MBR0730372.1 hypothetical protein [Bradyrhizobium japonicum]